MPKFNPEPRKIVWLTCPLCDHRVDKIVTTPKKQYIVCTNPKCPNYKSYDNRRE